MKILVDAIKRLSGRGIGSYRASFGPIEQTATTKAVAVAAVEKSVRDALDRLDGGTIIRSWNGRTYVVYPTPYGWAYWLDFFSAGYVNHANGTRAQCEERALAHLAQHVWDHDVPNDTAFLSTLPRSIRAELAGWIGFQRAYKVASAELPEHVRHAWACNNRVPVALPA